MLTNYHTHTTRCGHAEGTEEEYILTALRCGYKVLGFSDHTPWAYATPGFVSRIRMLPSQLDDYVLTLRGLREKYADKLHIRIGLEAEYFPAYLGWLKEEMERLDIEYLILGCHYDTTAKQITEDITKNITKICPVKIKTAISTGSACTAFKRCMTKLIVLTPFICITQNSIGFRSLLELLFGFCISWIHIRVIFFRQSSVCFFQSRIIRIS